jgi:hypothetical protein
MIINEPVKDSIQHCHPISIPAQAPGQPWVSRLKKLSETVGESEYCEPLVQSTEERGNTRKSAVSTVSPTFSETRRIRSWEFGISGWGDDTNQPHGEGGIVQIRSCVGENEGRRGLRDTNGIRLYIEAACLCNDLRAASPPHPYLRLWELRDWGTKW